MTGLELDTFGDTLINKPDTIKTTGMIRFERFINRLIWRRFLINPHYHINRGKWSVQVVDFRPGPGHRHHIIVMNTENDLIFFSSARKAKKYAKHGIKAYKKGKKLPKVVSM